MTKMQCKYTPPKPSDSWVNIITRWTPGGKEKGRPKTRWVEDIIALDTNRKTSAQDETEWLAQREAFVQQWSADGWR